MMIKDQNPLFEIPDAYPDTPGYRQTDTSFDAAQSVDAKTLRDQCMKVLAARPVTADECAAYLGVDKLSIRPRFSELLKKGKIVDSGERRVNIDSGKRAIVWKLISSADRP